MWAVDARRGLAEILIVRGGMRRSLFIYAAVHAGCLLDSREPDGASTWDVARALTEVTGASQQVTWTCAQDPCPWGSSLANPAVAWPASADPVATRLGYLASPAPYLPAEQANGVTVVIEDGSASLYAGEPQAASHRWLATLSAGQSYDVSGLADGEVFSVQSDTAFEYRVIPAPPPEPTDPGEASQTATWTCTSTPCPWGSELSGEALVWPADAGAIATRLGYSVSRAIYLPAERANRTRVEIADGEAAAYAGRPDDASHRWLATISAGQALDVTGLAEGEMLSVQAQSPFIYRLFARVPNDPPPDPDAIQAVAALWECNIPECTGAPWTGAVIDWPAWAAYHDNARAGDQSRSVFAEDGTPLHPYMGAWADGCDVTAVSGTVLIIEWQRGTDTWRETLLQPGQSHVIELVAPEDGAMIETLDGMSDFSVKLDSCTPQPL